MNWIDFLIIALILYNAARGFRAGLLQSAVNLIGFLIVLSIALTQFTRLSGPLSDMLSRSSNAIRWLSLLVCLGVASGLINVMARLVGHFIRQSNPSLFNRIGGTLLGSLRGVLVVSVALTVIRYFPVNAPFKSSLEQSALAPSAMSIVPIIYDGFVVKVVPGSRPFVDQIDRALTGSVSAVTETNAFTLRR